MKHVYLFGIIVVLISLLSSSMVVSAKPAVYEPSSEPLMIKDLESAIITLAQTPYKSFEINFRGGTDASSFANVFYFGYIPEVNPLYPFDDGNTASSPTPLIVQPSVNEINPILSPGDTVTITYDGGQELTIYLPYMDESVEWINLFVAVDGSTYHYYNSDTDTLAGPAATVPLDQVVSNPHPNEHANPRAFSGRLNSIKVQSEPSNQPLMIQDLESAIITMAQIPYKSFEINFRGGTDSASYANVFYFGYIPEVNPLYPFDDGNTASTPTPLIVQPSVNEINPILSQGDTVALTYDGAQELTIYLPYMDESFEWDNLFVATDGSTYFYYDVGTDTLQGPAAMAP